MPSLRTVALGLLIVFLDARMEDWDLVADPVGWLLVLVGLAPVGERLPGARGAAAVSLAASVLAWPPSSFVHDDESVEWLFSLPELVFGVLLAGALARVGPPRLSGRFRLVRTVYVVAAVLPVLIFGAGWEWLVLPAVLLVVATHVMFMVWLWAAGAPATAEPDGDAQPTR